MALSPVLRISNATCVICPGCTFTLLCIGANCHGMPCVLASNSSVKVHPGQMTQVAFEIRNTGDRTMVGQAIPSYGPKHAAEFVKKLECFCFKQQVLAAGERREMPVQFVIDPKLPASVNTLTLSYTFFEVQGANTGATGKAG